jgi:hypothetical protein
MQWLPASLADARWAAAGQTTQDFEQSLRSYEAAVASRQQEWARYTAAMRGSSAAQANAARRRYQQAVQAEDAAYQQFLAAQQRLSALEQPPFPDEITLVLPAQIERSAAPVLGELP